MDKTSILEYFAKDHCQLDRFLENFQNSKNASSEILLQAFNDFESGLKRHLELEETVLLPLVENKLAPDVPNIVGILRQEHRDIKECLEWLRQKVDGKDTGTKREEQCLFEVLVRHDIKEEENFYPLLDTILSEYERRTLLESLSNP